MKTIVIPIEQQRITIELDEQGSGTIHSTLTESIDPELDARASTGDLTAMADAQEEQAEVDEYNARIDGLESFLLALACEGVDVETPEFANAIQTALDAFANN